VEAQTEDEVGGTAEATAEAGEVVEVKDTETPHDKWTSSEEERFFSALKAKGNDLQHITAHVSSKNIAQACCCKPGPPPKLPPLALPPRRRIDHHPHVLLSGSAREHLLSALGCWALS
jgi:hypothetical protein